MIFKKLLFKKQTPSRWLVLEQSFLSMFLTFSLIEMTFVGADLVDGLIISNFLKNSRRILVTSVVS